MNCWTYILTEGIQFILKSIEITTETIREAGKPVGNLDFDRSAVAVDNTDIIEDDHLEDGERSGLVLFQSAISVLS